MTDPWFVTEKIDESTYLISEPLHVNCFLIVGSERAVLFDTGMGVADIGAIARQLTDRPLLIVNSHHHFDHVGGNHGFDDIAIHESGSELLAQGPKLEWVRNYWAGVREYLESYHLAHSVEQSGTTDERRSREWMRPLPARFEVETHASSPLSRPGTSGTAT